MDHLYINNSGHWVIRESEHELHSGDSVRLMSQNHLIPARIQLDNDTGSYLLIIDAGEEILPITPDLDIRAVLEGIL
ncbi:MAG: DUF5348 domain-containing protein [Anaerolineae bacterium]|nr:DUF5348 domain-containing protein [Anaerolineae bacterium]